MRKICIVIAIFAVFLAAGCATTQEGQQPIIQDEQAQDVIIEITARRLAYHVALNNPQIIEPGIAVCAAFEVEGVDLGPLLAMGIKQLDEELAGDPLLVADLETLLKLFNIAVIEPNVPLTDRQKAMVKLAAKSFKLGLMFAQANPK